MPDEGRGMVVDGSGSRDKSPLWWKSLLVELGSGITLQGLGMNSPIIFVEAGRVGCRCSRGEYCKFWIVLFLFGEINGGWARNVEEDWGTSIHAVGGRLL